jgi:hypothetical protein
MKCITVRQPWASLLVNGATQYLARGWRTHHRGRLAIHASVKLTRSHVELCCDKDMRRLLRGCGYDFALELPRQAILGTVTLADCIYVTETNQHLFDPGDPAVVFGLVRPGQWAWICSNHHTLARPVPMAGRLGVYAVEGEW